jgi:formamidopyrimidine-DNA glycosylase
MPELPDIAAYIGALESRIVGQSLQGIRLNSPFLLRTAQPPIEDACGRTVRELRRIGKRIVFGLDNDLWLVLHLMIAGRLHWRPAAAKLSRRQTLAAFDFPDGSLVLTEAGSMRRASLHILLGEENLSLFDAGGIDIFSTDLATFRATLTAENHTLKRALTDPRLLSGVGNAYSDEILHEAQLVAKPCNSGLTAFSPRPSVAFLKESPPSGLRWLSTAATASPAPAVGTPYNASATPTKKPTIAPAARPRARFWPIADYLVCWERTGLVLWKSWKR